MTAFQAAGKRANSASDSWLIISYFQNADGTAASHHSDDRVASLQALNVPFVVLSSPCGPRSSRFPHVRVASPMPSGIRYEIRRLLRRRVRSRAWFRFWVAVLLLPNLPFYLLEKLVMRLDSTWSWFLSAAPAAVLISLLTRPRIIYSTGGPWSAHVAAAVASRLCRVPLIVEFQDPPGYSVPRSGWERCLMQALLRFVKRSSKVIIFLTRQAAQEEAAASGCPTACIYPGAARVEPVVESLPREHFKLAHFGSLGGSRNLEGLLAGLELLFQQQPELAGVVRVHLYGNSSRNVQQQIESFPHPEIIIAEGKTTRAESLSAMQQANVLLLIQNADHLSHDTIPSKTYEYLQTSRPLLALLYRNDELKQMLLERGRVPVETDDAAAIKAALEGLVEQWRLDGLGHTAPQSPYTPHEAARRLIELAEQVSEVAL